MTHPTNILERIVVHKRAEIDELRRLRPVEALREQLADAAPVRDFCAALRARGGVALIAEVKRASPSAGLIRDGFDPVEIARVYERHGASCVSVLTDEEFFQGRLADLKAVRQAVGVPVLRKDFILDEYQIVEARVAGADCVLLIAECLADEELCRLDEAARNLGMQSLIEIYKPENMQRALALKPPLLGINNRNLATFVTDLEHTIALAAQAGDGTLLVSESGIRSRVDVERLQSAGVAAMLVGETLMRAPDIGAAVDELLVGREGRLAQGGVGKLP